MCLCVNQKKSNTPQYFISFYVKINQILILNFKFLIHKKHGIEPYKRQLIKLSKR